MTDLLFLQPSDPRWFSLLQSDPAATIFHHPAWMHLLKTSYGFRLFVTALENSSGELQAGLPFAEVNDHLTPRRWVALPFSDYCPPLYRNEEGLCQLLSRLVEHHQIDHCPRIEIRSDLPSQPNIQAQASFVRHSVLLESGVVKVAKGITRQQMQNVRTAEKNGIRIMRSTTLEDVRAFYRLHCLNRRKHGVPVQPWQFFQRLCTELLEPGLGFVLLAYCEDACISGGIFLHWQKTLTYKYSATDETRQNLRPNHLVTWTAMQYACEQGDSVFDFGRADLGDEGLREFKRRWGAVEDPLSYSFIPQASAVHRVGRLAGMLKKVISHSPVWVCQVAGELLYRFAG